MKEWIKGWKSLEGGELYGSRWGRMMIIVMEGMNIEERKMGGGIKKKKRLMEEWQENV